MAVLVVVATDLTHGDAYARNGPYRKVILGGVSLHFFVGTG